MRLESYPGITFVVGRVCRARCAPFCAVRLTVVPCEPSSAHVSLPYTMTGNTYSLCTFLFTFILAYLLFMMLATLLNAAHPSAMRILISGRRSPACVTVLPRYTYRSTFSMIFPSTTTVDVVAWSWSYSGSC